MMSFSKYFLGLFVSILLVSCGGTETEPSTSSSTDTDPDNASPTETPTNNSNAAAPSTTTTTNTSETPPPVEPDELTGTFCYALNDEISSAWAQIKLGENQQAEGKVYAQIYDIDTAYVTASSQQATGIYESGILYMQVETTIGDETTESDFDEGWMFSLQTLDTLDLSLSRIGCNEYARYQDYFEANPPQVIKALREGSFESTEETESIIRSQQDNKVDNCNASESVFLAAETENFWVSICGGDLPQTYVGVGKKTGDKLRLELDYYDQDGSYFEAFNGEYTYSVVIESAKGSFLTVAQGDKQILQEPLISW